MRNGLKRAFMSRTSDIQEIADHLNNHLMAPAEDKKTEADEIDRAAQNTLNDEQEGAESAEIGSESKAKMLRSRDKAYVGRQLSSTMLLTLVAVLLMGLLFFIARVVFFFSGSRKSRNRQRRR
jgi:ElaB/YqjD/DUF883 family membrane-anchored ribosome-binding protein